MSEQFKIIKTTYKLGDQPKAHLLETKEGKTCWISARMLRKDGSLTSKGVDALKNAEVNVNPSDKEYEITVAWESDKAVGMDRQIELHGQFKTVRIFFPKSQIRQNKVKGWLWDIKMGQALKDNTINYESPWFVD